jgi:hypothetical protein
MDGRCTLLLTILLGAPEWCSADENVSAAPLQAAPVTTPSLIIMVDGKVLAGHFTVRPDGYDVATPAGRMFIGSDRVRFTATDLADAYRRMKATYAERTPENHMELARWCLTNKLTEEARREVLDALHLDPNRRDAQRLLSALVDDGDRAASSRYSGLTEFASGRSSAAPAFESRSLAGFSKPVAQNFTRHVQPLLMNKCAGVGCHGGHGSSAFQLTSAHRGSSPTIAERNLAAVLRQVDLTSPDESPLLSVMNTNHASLATPIFRGRTGTQQMETLRNWVRAAVRDITPEAAAEPSPPASEIQLAAASTVEKQIRTSAEDQAGLLTPHGRKLTTADTDQKFVAQAQRRNAHDAFDPSEFNRRFHATDEAPAVLNQDPGTNISENESLEREQGP